jgi:hypothetical protein
LGESYADKLIKALKQMSSTEVNLRRTSLHVINYPVLARRDKSEGANHTFPRAPGTNWNPEVRSRILQLSGFPVLAGCVTIALCPNPGGPASRRIRLPKCPNRQLRSIGNPQFSEYAIQIFFDGPFGQMQLMSDFFVELRLLNELDDLFFPET